MEPRNLHDWELNKDMTELSPSRPPGNATPVAYLVTKSPILAALGKIVHYFSNLQPVSYETIAQLGDELLQAHLNVPQHLLKRNRLEANSGPESINLKRTQLEFLYHQGTFMLHRKFFTRSRTDERYFLSRPRCLESSMALLRMQNML